MSEPRGPQFNKEENLNETEQVAEKEQSARMEKIKKLFNELWVSIKGTDGEIRGTENYTLISDPIGFSSIENSPMASSELMFSLALTAHPLVEELVNIDESRFKYLEKSEQDTKFLELVKSKVLKGFKILDLGCGHSPTFARVARALGAEVYTVDQFEADKFEYDHKGKIKKSIISKEVRAHIALDLNSRDAVQMIKDRTGGDFDLVAEAHLTTEGFFDGIKIATPLLKQGGIHFDPTNGYNAAVKNKDNNLDQYNAYGKR